MRKFLFVLAGLTLLTACGQNGALYLPEDAKPPTNSAESTPPDEMTSDTSTQTNASDK